MRRKCGLTLGQLVPVPPKPSGFAEHVGGGEPIGSIGLYPTPMRYLWTQRARGVVWGGGEGLVALAQGAVEGWGGVSFHSSSTDTYMDASAS